MSGYVKSEEFTTTARRLFRRLSAWSGELLRSASMDDEARRGAQARVDTGKMAALKRGLRGQGSPVASVAWVIDPLIPDTWDSNSPEYIAIYQAALLFALHPHSLNHSDAARWETTITRAFSLANGDRRKGTNEEHAANDRRINRILDAQPYELFPRLKQSLPALMNDSEQLVDWVQLAGDLKEWNDPRQSVQQRWARGWYGGPAFIRQDDDSPVAEEPKESSEES